MERKTELVNGSDPKKVKGQDMFVVTTDKGNQLWIPASKYNPDAETITFDAFKEGDTFVARKDSSRVHPEGHAQAGQPIYLKGATVKYTKPSLQFVCFSTKQVVKKSSMLEILAFMAEKGMNNAISLAGV